MRERPPSLWGIRGGIHPRGRILGATALEKEEPPSAPPKKGASFPERGGPPYPCRRNNTKWGATLKKGEAPKRRGVQPKEGPH